MNFIYNTLESSIIGHYFGNNNWVFSIRSKLWNNSEIPNLQDLMNCIKEFWMSFPHTSSSRSIMLVFVCYQFSRLNNVLFASWWITQWLTPLKVSREGLSKLSLICKEMCQVNLEMGRKNLEVSINKCVNWKGIFLFWNYSIMDKSSKFKIKYIWKCTGISCSPTFQSPSPTSLPIFTI